MFCDICVICIEVWDFTYIYTYIYISFLGCKLWFEMRNRKKKLCLSNNAADKQHCLMICCHLNWLIHIHITFRLAQSTQDPLQIRLFPSGTYCSAPWIVKDCWFICIFLMKSVCSYLRLTIIKKCCILSLCSHLCLIFKISVMLNTSAVQQNRLFPGSQTTCSTVLLR